MNILFDHQIFSFQNYGGASRYYYELYSNLKGLHRSVNCNVSYSNNVYAKKIKSSVKPYFPEKTYPYKNISLFYLNRVLGDKEVSKGSYDVLHPTYYHPYFLKLKKDKPFVITVLDMIHEKFKDVYKVLNSPTIEFKRKVIESADAVLAISENTKKDILEYYSIDPSKIHVTYLGNSLQKIKPIKLDHVHPQNYILYVGTRSGYKNFTFFIEAIAKFIKQENISLICLGGGGFSKNESVVIKKLGLESLVLHYDIGSDSELAYYYQQALTHVVPSLYEGFGLTLLESFVSGTPVAASNSSSIPEVGGNAVSYFDPKDKESINTSVKKSVVNEAYRKKLISNGKLRAKEFSWVKTSKATSEVYSKLY